MEITCDNKMFQNISATLNITHFTNEMMKKRRKSKIFFKFQNQMKIKIQERQGTELQIFTSHI